MRWHHCLLPVLLIVRAPAEDPAAPGVAATAVELGGRFAPAVPTTVRWQTRTELTGGVYQGIRGILPMEGKIEKVDEREVLTTYASETEREVTLVKGLTTQTETFEEKPEKKEKRQALEAVPVVGRKTDGKWSFTPAAGDPTEAQKPELDRLGRRANEEVDLFQGVRATPGQAWDLDPAKFLKAAGFDDITTVKGKARATLTEVASTPDGPEAVIGLEIDLRAEQSPATGSSQRLRLEYTGRLTRALTTKLDRLVELDGRMSVTGETVAEGQRNPFSLVSPVKVRSQREIVKK